MPEKKLPWEKQKQPITPSAPYQPVGPPPPHATPPWGDPHQPIYEALDLIDGMLRESFAALWKRLDTIESLLKK